LDEMTPILSQVIAAICRERDERFDDTFQLVQQLLSEYGEHDLANRLFAEIPRDVPFEVVTDLLGILSWSGSDACVHEIGRTTEGWLKEGKDNRKLQIALHGEAYPFADIAEMERILSHLAQSNEHVRGRCLLLIEQRREQEKRRRRHRRFSSVRRLLRGLGFMTPLVVAVVGQSQPAEAVRRQQFTRDLVAAAVERTHHVVRYDPGYLSIPYPGGDVPPETGVCTDEVIRSYRAVGVDLQVEVHKDIAANFAAYPSRTIWRLEHPDKNIDHRRVPNLMVFFRRKGEALPITNHAEDYSPGDLVTWDLGSGLVHIGMVVDQKGLLGRRFMIVHNIGEGPKMEDVLFNWKIIGHYRYFGPTAAPIQTNRQHHK